MSPGFYVCVYLCVSLFITVSVFLGRLCVSALTRPGRLYLFLSLCVCIYRCVCVSVFFMPLCASVHIYLCACIYYGSRLSCASVCVCIYYCGRLSRASVCVCTDTPGSVYIYSSLCVSVFIAASVRLCFSRLSVSVSELPRTAVFPELLISQ